ncbi:alpha-ketoglutarate-dependent taurine dioxygenase [Bradyrhizobium sp. RT6a]
MAAPYGGATVWSNTAAAYDDLPLSMRMLAGELWAVHANGDRHGLKDHSTEVKEAQLEEMFTGTIYETPLPVVLTHPQTGERMLMLGCTVRRFVGLQTHTGQKLLDLFHSYIKAPHNSVRWKWREGDVAIWDNRLTQSANDHSTAAGRDARGLGSPPCLTRSSRKNPKQREGRAAQGRMPRLAPDYALRRATRLALCWF